jgi:excinuclease UvrABC helicase subunit UvrB
MSVKLINLNKKYKKMLRRRFNFNDLFSEFDSLFDGFNSYGSNPLMVRGKKNVESGDDEDGTWTKETFTSDDGTYQITSIYRYNREGTPKQKSNEISVLERELKNAVEKQDYETAAKLRDQIKTIESNKEKIDEIQSKLDEAVNKQDFESAIKLRDKLNKLKS